MSRGSCPSRLSISLIPAMFLGFRLWLAEGDSFTEAWTVPCATVRAPRGQGAAGQVYGMSLWWSVALVPHHVALLGCSPRAGKCRGPHPPRPVPAVTPFPSWAFWDTAPQLQWGFPGWGPEGPRFPDSASCHHAAFLPGTFLPGSCQASGLRGPSAPAVPTIPSSRASVSPPVFCPQQPHLHARRPAQAPGALPSQDPPEAFSRQPEPLSRVLSFALSLLQSRRFPWFYLPTHKFFLMAYVMSHIHHLSAGAFVGILFPFIPFYLFYNPTW